MAFNVKLKTNALLKQDNELLIRENDLLRDRMARTQEMAEQKQEAAECIECDMHELKKQRKFLEYRTDKELRLNQKGHSHELCDHFAYENKSKLLVLLQQFQLLKSCMAEAELAKTVFEMWRCRTQGSEDSLGQLIEKINCELESCPETLNPFVVDHIKDVMKDCY